MLERIGRRVATTVHVLLDMSALVCESGRTIWTARTGRRLVFEVSLRQILFTGVEALRVISIIALLLGFVTIIETFTQLPRVGGEAYIGKMLVLVVVRELGPILTAFIVIGRSGTAVATEIGNMMVNHEIQAIEMMGVNPLHFVVLPRLIGVTIAVACLSLYFNVVALFGGYFFSRLFVHYPFHSFLQHLSAALSGWDVAVSVIKCSLFGILVAVICCSWGFSVKFSSTEVPQVTTRAVVGSIYACFLLNAVVTAFFYL